MRNIVRINAPLGMITGDGSSPLVGDKTAIYISHRLSCRFCDDIVVFENGQIIQHGNHDQYHISLIHPGGYRLTTCHMKRASAFLADALNLY